MHGVVTTSGGSVLFELRAPAGVSTSIVRLQTPAFELLYVPSLEILTRFPRNPSFEAPTVRAMLNPLVPTSEETQTPLAFHDWRKVAPGDASIERFEVSPGPKEAVYMLDYVGPTPEACTLLYPDQTLFHARIDYGSTAPSAIHVQYVLRVIRSGNGGRFEWFAIDHMKLEASPHLIIPVTMSTRFQDSLSPHTQSYSTVRSWPPEVEAFVDRKS